MKQKMISFLCAALTGAALLCGCQKSPETSAVISKNDGSFDIGILQSATHPQGEAEATAGEDVGNLFQYQDRFFSTDGKVEFQMEITEDFPDQAMPVVEVAPHFFTGEDAKRIAYALFGEGDYYEAEPLMAPVYSKSEIQEKIARWSAYDGSLGGYDISKSGFIKNYTLMMETAPDENPHTPCQWTFRKATFYLDGAEAAAQADTSQDNDEIQVSVKVDGIPFLFAISTRNKADFKINNLSIYPYDGSSPAGVDNYIFRERLCRTEKPNEADVEAVKSKAEALLEQMAVGDWAIDQCYVEETQDDHPEYTIVVKAVPSFQQVAAIRLPQLSNLKSEVSYASTYYLTDVEFTFNISGDLVNLDMRSPVDIVSVINEDVQTLSKEELMQTAKNYFTHTEYETYTVGYDIASVGEELGCRVVIDDVEYGLARVKVPNTADSYYYVPAMCFKGKIENYGKDSGRIYTSNIFGEGPRILLLLNAVDGTVINTNQ